MDPSQAPEAIPPSNDPEAIAADKLEAHRQNEALYHKDKYYYQNHQIEGGHAYHAVNAYHPDGYQKGGSQPPKRKIMGLRPATFWLSLVLTFVIIASAVGGGVGGALAVANAKKSNDDNESNPSPTAATIPSDADESTNTASDAASKTSSAAATAFTAPSETTLPLDCEGDGQDFKVVYNKRVYDFELLCNTNRISKDATALKAYSLRDCCYACIKFVSKWGIDSCTGVVFESELTEERSNCWLKNGTMLQSDMKLEKSIVVGIPKWS